MTEVETPPMPRSAKPLRAALIVILVLAVAAAAGVYFRGRTVSEPVVKALAGETGADTRAYRRNWVSGTEIVFDIASVGETTSMADIMRRLLKAAEALKDQKFDRVYLAYRGKEKFYLEGSYFQQLGIEREFQNPIYTIRTLPAQVHKLDGSPAFGAWTGGWLGVMGKELEDHNEFHQQWWVRDAISGLGK